MRELYRAIRWRLIKATLSKEVAKIDNDFFQASNNSDISEHLSTIYSICLARKPNTILELGTRGGESTRVFIKYCEKFSKFGMSVDLCTKPDWMSSKNWTHFVGDDIELGTKVHKSNVWPNGDVLKPIDLIFIDSSHEYDHTLKELGVYWDMLSTNGILVCHDTNLTDKFTRKLDGTPNIGWNNSNGVSRAIEDFFDFKFNWNNLQSVESHTTKGQISVAHYPWNNGLTLIFKN